MSCHMKAQPSGQIIGRTCLTAGLVIVFYTSSNGLIWTVFKFVSDLLFAIPPQGIALRQ